MTQIGPGQNDPAEQPESASDPARRDAEHDQHPGRRGGTALYVRDRRSPALGFWVVAALLVPAAGGLIAAPFLGVSGAGGLLLFAVIAMLGIGVPLAALAALADLFLEQRRER